MLELMLSVIRGMEIVLRDTWYLVPVRHTRADHTLRLRKGYTITN